MSEQDTSSSHPVHLREEQDGPRQFVLHPEDEDRFVRTGKQIIEACRLDISIDLWLDAFNGMLKYVSTWSGQRKNQVRACFVSGQGGQIVLFFVPWDEHFDFELADALTELNSQLVKTFNIGMIETQQIPWGELDRFIDPDYTKHIYGQHPESHRPVEA